MRVLDSQREGAKEAESAVENTMRNDTVADLGVRTAIITRASFQEAFKRVLIGKEPKNKRSRVIAETRATRSQAKSGQNGKFNIKAEIDDAKVAATTSARGAALAARAKIRSFYKESPEKARDYLDTFHDDVDEAVVKRGFHSLHSMTLRRLQECPKQESPGTVNVSLPAPKVPAPKVPKDQMTKPSWISIEALEKVRELEDPSIQYSKAKASVPKPVALLSAPFQHEASPPTLPNSAQYQESPTLPRDIDITIEFVPSVPIQVEDSQQPSVPSVPRQKANINHQRCFSPDITTFRSN